MIKEERKKEIRQKKIRYSDSGGMNTMDFEIAADFKNIEKLKETEDKIEL